MHKFSRCKSIIDNREEDVGVDGIIWDFPPISTSTYILLKW